MLFIVALAVGGGSYAQEEKTVTLQLSSSAKFETKSGSTLTQLGVTWTVTTISGSINGSYQTSYNGEQFGVSKTPWEGTFSTSDIAGEITKVDVAANTGGAATLSVKVGDVDFTSDSKTQVPVTKVMSGINTYSFEGNAEGEIVVTLKGTSKACYLGSITVTYKDTSSKTATTVSFGADNDNKTFDLSIGDAFTAPTATLTPAEAGDVVYSSDNENVAKVDAKTGAVTLGETAGTAKITASFAGNDTYAASSASYTIKLTKPFTVEDGEFDFSHPEAYGKGTSNGSLHDGDMDEGESIKAGNVTLTVTKNGTTTTRFWINGSDIDFRVYQNAKLTLSVPDGYVIASVTTSPNSKSQTISNLNQQNVELTYTGGVKLKSITVTYVKAPVVEDVTLSVGSTGYATLYYSDRALTVPENTEAYTYSAEFGNGLEESKRFEEGEVIPAGEAVVVFALEPGNYTFKVADGTGVKLDDTNMLSGTDEETLITDDANTYKFYKLSLNDAGDANSVGFYWGADNGGAFVNSAHKAYLKVTKENAANAKAFVFGGNATGIKTLKANENNTNAPLYNLAGQRVGKSYKGIVIMNGKKYVK